MSQIIVHGQNFYQHVGKKEARSFWFPLLNKQYRTKTKTKTIGQETRNINQYSTIQYSETGTIIKQWNLNDKFI